MKDSIALDTETTGLEETDRPFSFSVATREGATNFDERIWQEQTWEIARGYACNPNGVIFMQNAKFDMRMLSTKGVEVRGDIHDITALARLVRNDHLAYNLDSQAKRILNEPKDAGVMDYIKAHNLYEIRHDFFGEEYKQPQFDKVPLEVMAPYATKDAVLTRRLGEYYLQKIQGTRAMQVVENESKLVKTCYAMERRGLLLNKEYTLQAYHSERAIVEKLKQDFQDLTGQAYKDSAKSMQPLLTYRLPKTKEGNPSLDKHALKDLLRNGDTRDRQIAEMIRVIRKYDKRIATYYKNYLNKMDHEGVIHPTMWQAGTRTGRFSYSDPNFQNMPKDEDEGELYTIRGCLRPRAGRVYVSLDYSQMEYRMAVAYANESKVIREVMAGADFHQSTADMIGITRSQAKTLNFACLYGAGPRKIAEMLGVSAEEGKRLLTKYFYNLPRLEDFLRQVKITAETRGHIFNWYGRPLYFSWYTDPVTRERFHDGYSAPNHLIQGGGADVVKLAMNRIHEEFPDLLMVLQVHDQLVFEMTPEEYQYIPRIKQIMEEAFPPMNGMQLRVDIEWSSRSLAANDMTKGLPCA